MAIKSSYELAMERMAKQSPQPTRKLTAKDKERLAEFDRIYAAKIAEEELALKPKIAAARSHGQGGRQTIHPSRWLHSIRSDQRRRPQPGPRAAIARDELPTGDARRIALRQPRTSRWLGQGGFDPPRGRLAVVCAFSG